MSLAKFSFSTPCLRCVNYIESKMPSQPFKGDDYSIVFRRNKDRRQNIKVQQGLVATDLFNLKHEGIVQQQGAKVN